MAPRLRTLGYTYKHLKRYRDIVIVLVKHGFGDFITSINLPRHVDLSRRLLRRQPGVKIGTYSRWERVR